MTVHISNDQTKEPPILIIGGGRWARVIMSVLISLVSNRKIIWLTRHDAESNRNWLHTQGYSNVLIMTDSEKAWQLPIYAVIIASSSRDHAKDLTRAVQLSVPALCEKPFSMGAAQARQIVALSELRSVVAGVNLEFLYASYLHEFASLLKTSPPRLIEIRWCDPCNEIRYGEQKFGEIHTPLVHDSLPHCWSLLRVIFDESPIELISATYCDSSEIIVRAVCGQASIRIVLNRRAQHRERKITIDNGQFALDFSNEPGRYVTPSRDVVENKWSGLRPLGASLFSFLKKLEDPNHIFPSSIKECLPSVEFCSDAHGMISNQLRDSLMSHHRSGTLEFSNTVARNSLVDLMVPQLKVRLTSSDTVDSEEMFLYLKGAFLKEVGDYLSTSDRLLD